MRTPLERHLCSATTCCKVIGSSGQCSGGSSGSSGSSSGSSGIITLILKSSKGPGPSRSAFGLPCAGDYGYAGALLVHVPDRW